MISASASMKAARTTHQFPVKWMDKEDLFP